MRSRLSLIAGAGWLALGMATGGTALGQAAPETIEAAIAQLTAITHPDPHKRDELKARAAFTMVRDRIKIINDVSGATLQILPADVWNYFTECGNILARAEALDVVRKKGWDLARASWIIKAGACDENASLMTELLKGSGVADVVILRSGSPHAFPVIGLAPDADPDIPWTWGPNAVVPDSWNGQFNGGPFDPEKLWNDSVYFNGGENFVAPYAHTTTRELLKQMTDRGDDYIKQHCELFRPAMKKFMLIPEKHRQKMSLKPPAVEAVCPATAWVGDTWTGFRGRSLYSIRNAETGLVMSWTTDGQPEGEYHDCKLSGAEMEIADCQWRQTGIGGTVHLAFVKEQNGDRITGKAFDGTDYWDVELWRDH